jgi:hypothetical protein
MARKMNQSEITDLDKRLTRIEVLLTNHLEHVKEDLSGIRKAIKILSDNYKNIDLRVYRNTVLIMLSVILLLQSNEALALLKALY